MKILSKFSYKTNDCYVVEDAGIRYPITMRGLYTEDILTELINNGYKVYDYHGKILSPEGVYLEDLVEEPFSPSDVEVQAMYDMEDGAMSEAEATAYFAREANVSKVQFKEPVNIEIKTREELIKYLLKFRARKQYKLTDTDFRPLNSFVAKEALFSIDEIVEKPDNIYYFRIIEERRKLTIEAYNKLIEFLKEHAGLGENYKDNDIKNAYLSWGICGIKDDVVDMKVRSGVRSSIYTIDEALEESNANVGQLKQWCLMDRRGNIYSSLGVSDISDYDDYSLAEVCPSNIDLYEEDVRRSSDWEYDFKPLQCWVNNPRVRTYYTVMTENGCTYRVKVDHDNMVIQSKITNVLTSEYIRVGLVTGASVPINYIGSTDEFSILNLAALKVKDIMGKKTIVPKYKNTFDLMVGEGMNPMAAIEMMGKMAVEDYEAENSKVKSDSVFNLIGAGELYKDGPSNLCIRKYNPDDLEYNNIDELIDIFLNTRSALEQEGTYMNEEISTEFLFELVSNPIEMLEFARNCMDGNITLGHMDKGRILDGDVEIVQVARLFRMLITIINGNKVPSVEQAQAILMNIEDNDKCNIDEIIGERIHTWEGCLKDIAALHARRANECSNVMLTEFIIREAGNCDYKHLRHYGMEGYTLNLRDEGCDRNAVRIMNSIADSIVNATKGLRVKTIYRECMRIAAPSTALKLMFNIKFNKEELVTTDNDKAIVKVTTMIDGQACDINIEIRLSDYNYVKQDLLFESKWVSLYEWCSMETSGGICNFYNLNARITPWQVIPNDGVTLKEYSFEINWIRNKVLSTFPEAFRNDVNDKGSRIRNYSSYYIDTGFIDNSFYESTDQITKYTNDTIDHVLDSKVFESMARYQERFSMHNKAASANGKYLRRMRLKSDVVFANFASRFCPEELLVEDDEYSDIVDRRDCGRWLTNHEPGLVYGKDKVVGNRLEGSNVLTRFNWQDEPFEDVIKWQALISGTYRPYTVNMLVGNTLYCCSTKGHVSRDLSALTKDDLIKLVNKNIIYQLSSNDYLIRTNTGDYKLTVK